MPPATPERRWSQRLPLSVRLGLAFLVPFVLFGAALTASNRSAGAARDEIERLVGQEMRLRHEAAVAETAMLQGRRSEKDFLARRDEAYVESFAGHHATLLGAAGAIVEVAEAADRPEFARLGA